jgi:uncharacterized membrane protein YeaQ/YmgE (transglycosylase-associated protein family)
VHRYDPKEDELYLCRLKPEEILVEGRIGLIIVGLIVGALGRLINPGANPIGLLFTIGIGIASMLVAGLVFGGILQWIVGIIVATLGAVVLLFLLGLVKKRA